jgi:PleD family two-component response regulator
VTIQSSAAHVIERPVTMQAQGPIASNALRRRRSEALAPGGRMNATILVVEDDRNIGDLLRTYLERDGYRVLWVRSGEAGPGEIERHPVSLVVLDVGLPGIDGFEVCRRIRARGETPVIMLAARDEEADRVVWPP